MLNEFRKFLSRGNIVDMAVGIIIGIAFGRVISSLVNDIIMPPIGLLLGKVDFTNLFINLSNKPYATLAEAKAAGAPTINYGLFINNILDFVIVAFAVFLVVVWFNRIRKRYEKPAPMPTPTKQCPYCMTDIPLGAKRCPNCTSKLEEDEEQV